MSVYLGIVFECMQSSVYNCLLHFTSIKAFTTQIVSFDQRKLHQFNLTLGGMLGLYVILSFYYIFLAQKIAIFNLGQIEFD